MKSLWQQSTARKSMSDVSSDDEGHSGPGLKKMLTALDVFFHGVGAIIGTGIFVLTGVAAATYAGPAIIMSFVFAGLVCAFVSFAYAEMASMIPRSGSAYTYAYATMGELLAWFIGWDLLLEYCVGASAVAVGWSAYMQNILRGFGLILPAWASSAPASFPWLELMSGLSLVGLGYLLIAAWYNRKVAPSSNGSVIIGLSAGTAGIVLLIKVLTSLSSVDLPAIFIVGFINFWLVRGVSHTAKMTAVFVTIKLAVILLFIAVGAWHVETSNYVPFLPFGWTGVFTGAGIVFFAYIGFDAVSTLAEECKDPRRDMPRGIIWSLGVCALLYVLVAAIMTGALNYTLLGGSEAAAPMAKVMDHIGAWWASPLVSLGAIAGITSVLIVLLFGQSRIMMAMSRDGLIAPVFSKIHPSFGTPHVSILVLGLVAAISSGFIPIAELAELSSIGTLAAFVVCCVGVIVLRQQEPNWERRFKCPGYPWVPALGAVLCLVLMFSLPWVTWLRFIGWMLIGMAIYFYYGRYNSKLNRQ